MKSKKSFFSKAIIVNNLMRFWWSFALTGFILFLLVPLQILNVDVEYFIEKGRKIYLTGDYLVLTNLISCVFPVIVATLVFRYLQTSKSVTAMHSMPYTRLRLYVNNVLSGLIMVLIPFIINLVVILWLKGLTQFGNIMELQEIWKYFGISTMISITVYAISVMVGMFTGSSIAQMVFTYILNFLPLAIIGGSYLLLYGLFYGLKEIDVSSEVLRFMPMTQVIRSNWKDINILIWINSIITVVALVIGYFVYKFRNLERAGDVISNGVLKPIFKYGVTTCVMAVGVIYIKFILEIPSPNVLVYILFAAIGYAIAQMLLIKSFKILKYYKGFLGYTAVIIVLLIAIHFDVIGFEKRVPEIAEVDAVVLGYYNNIKEVDFDDLLENRNAEILRTQDNIKTIIDIHQDIVNTQKNSDEIYGGFNIGYKLKNGKFIERAYPINVHEEYEEKIKNVYNSVEYKIQSYDIFSYDEERLKEIVVNNHHDYFEIPKEEEKELLKLIKNRILEPSYEEGRDFYDMYEILLHFEEEINEEENSAVTMVSVSELGRHYYSTIAVGITKEDVELVNYIKQYLGIISPNDINYIQLSYEENDKTFEVEINDKEKIAEFADNFQDLTSSRDENDVRVYIYTRNSSRMYIGSFDKNDVIFSKYLN